MSGTAGALLEVAPDAAICTACAAELDDPFSRRYRYAFTACTRCGPRLTITTGVPFGRAQTTMAGFDPCSACAAECRDPADRRFHAETTACQQCGPRARLVRLDGIAVTFDQHSMLDDVDAAGALLLKGALLAIKGLGGYHLACDATNEEAVLRLRARKGREGKPFALLAPGLEVIRRYCSVGAEEQRALESAAAPIVLLDASGPERLPESIAPGLRTLGFMLPSTPLHLLLARRVARPLVMTSGNLSEEPQITADGDVRARLAGLAHFALLHDREIASRVDDSVARLAAGRVRLLRRARGYAPGPLRLPEGFAKAPPLLAFGAHRKATFCLVRGGEAILSQHQGDLEEERTFDDYRRHLDHYGRLFAHRPCALATDLHQGYASTRLARQRASEEGLPVVAVQHHHAHVAACLAENGRPLGAPPVLGIALDGVALGEGGELWGGELLIAGYRRAQRVATFKPVALLGGDHAGRQPWRSLYAHLMAELGWPAFSANFSALPLFAALAARPRAALDALLRDGQRSPKASSCGRLFEAVAAALGLCAESQAWEGEAAARLEALADADALGSEGDEFGYPFTVSRLAGTGLPYVEHLGAWHALLDDLLRGTPPGVISARFHRGLARVLARLVRGLARRDGEGGPRFDTVALSGGCFQNRVLLEQLERRLVSAGFTVLTHAEVPPGDGGLALGQAAVAAARLLAEKARAGAGGRALAAGW